MQIGLKHYTIIPKTVSYFIPQICLPPFEPLQSPVLCPMLNFFALLILVKQALQKKGTWVLTKS